jgi:putative hydrolase of the HAD superfamily
MIHAICFDFDGTLAHFAGDFFAHMKESAFRLDVPEPLHDAFITTYLKYDKSCSSFPEACRKTFVSLERELPKDFESYCQQTTERYTSYIELLQGAEELLEYLTTKKIPLAVITNGTKDIQTAAIQKVAIQDYFKTILISGELGIRKPDTRIFHLACEGLQVQPENCLMIGDSLSADIAGAKSIGMQVAWMSKEQAEGVRAFSNLSELQGWLEGKLTPLN